MGIDVYTPTKALIAEDYWKYKAASLLNISDQKDAFWFWDDFQAILGASSAGSRWGFAKSGGGSVDAVLVDGAGGIAQLAAGSGGTDYVRLTDAWSWAGNNIAGQPGGATGRWVLGCRIAVTTSTFGNTSQAGLAIYKKGVPYGNTVGGVGLIGSVSTTNYAMKVDGGATKTINSGVPIDTGMHDILLVQDTGVMSMIVDDVTVASAVAAFPSTATWGYYPDVTTGNAGAALTGQIDWVFSFAEVSR